MDQAIFDAIQRPWSLMVLSLSAAAGLFFLFMILVSVVKWRARLR